ncbi:NfeD family protein [Ammonicoccus fulvus]|uniref:NfeD family protein n=1 Tax=Ammonicoccus fulvus TaxID=3138240 RepID=A0ABZ3FMT7_9ACTN
MGEWLQQNLWAAWLALALILGASEMLTLELTLLMLASGALAGMVTSLILPGALVIQIVVAVIVSVLMLFVLRPTLLRKVRSAPGYRSALEKLVGSEGIATAQITADGGEVKINGETWSARAYDPDRIIAPGERVEVFEIDGVTALVHPRFEILP